jgi:hypothetical protein
LNALHESPDDFRGYVADVGFLMVANRMIQEIEVELRSIAEPMRGAPDLPGSHSSGSRCKSATFDESGYCRHHRKQKVP